MITIIVKLIGW